MEKFNYFFFKYRLLSSRVHLLFTMDVFGCPFLYGQHYAPVYYQCGQIPIVTLSDEVRTQQN